jgi:ribosomal protein S18 acetylase RimI-like enzyme
MPKIIINEAHLYNIAVEKKYQNNKVGFKLIKHLIEQS